MENPYYRPLLERLNAVFGNRDVLLIKDIMEFEGKDRKTIKRKYAIDSEGMLKVEYAKIASSMKWNKLPDTMKRMVRKAENI